MQIVHLEDAMYETPLGKLLLSLPHVRLNC